MLIGGLTLLGYFWIFQYLNHHKKIIKLYDEIATDLHLIDNNPQAIIMKGATDIDIISIYRKSLTEAIFSGYPLKKRLKRLREFCRNDIKLSRQGQNIVISLVARLAISLICALFFRYFLSDRPEQGIPDFFSCLLGSLSSFLGISLYHRLVPSPSLTESNQSLDAALQHFFSLKPSHLSSSEAFDRYLDTLSKRQSDVEHKLTLLEDVSSLFELTIASVLVCTFNIFPMLGRF